MYWYRKKERKLTYKHYLNYTDTTNGGKRYPYFVRAARRHSFCTDKGKMYGSALGYAVQFYFGRRFE